jgi:hypothetical protein
VSQNSKVPDPELVDKEIKVLELRRAGLTWSAIADQTGYADATGAYAAYKRAIKRVLDEPADEVRKQELDRIDRLQVAVWNRALKGDDKAINTVLRLMERRARLLGLDAAQRVQAEVVTYDGHRDIDGEIERILQIIRSVDHGEPLALESGPSESGTVTTEGEVVDLVVHGGAGSGENEDSSGVVSVGSDQSTEN